MEAWFGSNPADRTLCFGSFGFDIPVMWAEQDKLA
jgi:hypothetical protein